MQQMIIGKVCIFVGGCHTVLIKDLIYALHISTHYNMMVTVLFNCIGYVASAVSLSMQQMIIQTPKDSHM
jgi:hypothetical protein